MARGVLPLSTIVNAAGGAVVTISSGAQNWDISQVTIECLVSALVSGAPVGATGRLRWNGALISKMAPSGDVASGDPTIPLLQGQSMTMTWTGCTPGAVASVTVIYDDGR